MGRITDLALKYESNGDPGAVSCCEGDSGGVSYGLFQLSTNAGSVAEFVDWLAGRDHPFVVVLQRSWPPGSREFSAGWKYLANQYPEEFARLQTDYAVMQYFDVAVDNAAEIEFSVLDRSVAVQAVIFSAAVQYGSGAIPELIKTAGTDLGDADLIQAIYDVRKSDGWTAGSPDLRDALRDRFAQECDDALKMLEVG